MALILNTHVTDDGTLVEVVAHKAQDGYTVLSFAVLVDGATAYDCPVISRGNETEARAYAVGWALGYKAAQNAANRRFVESLEEVSDYRANLAARFNAR